MLAPEEESEEEGAAEGRNKWVKTQDKPVKEKKVKIAAESEVEPEEDEFIVVGKGGKSVELSLENLFKKLKELVELRGKKSTDKLSMIHQLQKLLQQSKSAYQKSRVLLALIPAQFDYTSVSLGYMTIDVWKRFSLSNTAPLPILVS